MGRPCSICCDSRKYQLVREMIAAGASDQAIADRIGGAQPHPRTRQGHRGGCWEGAGGRRAAIPGFRRRHLWRPHGVRPGGRHRQRPAARP